MKAILLIAVLLANLMVSVVAAERPVVALVLSGGGAKGMAHVGVLRVLEEMRIPVDFVIGTSAGSAVGALYASGMSVIDIERRFIELDWLSSFRDSPGRAYKPVRRKQEEWRFPISPRIGLGSDGLHAGSGLISGQNLGFILNELTHNAALVEDFDRLAIPFRAVATDLETGSPVVIGKGNLAEAIRASMSIPGVYAPVEWGDRVLVDGGVANNLPISVARDMGADIIIAVDISEPMMKVDDLKEAFLVVGQLTTILVQRNTIEQLKLLNSNDVLIHPNLAGFGSLDFHDASILFELGATCAREHAVQLSRLAVSQTRWDAYKAEVASRVYSAGPIVGISVQQDSKLASDFLRGRIRQQIGEPLDVDMLETDLKRIYGLGYYETVSYSLSPSPTGTVLVIRVQEKSWGPGYLAFGLNFEGNFNGDNYFNIASSLRMTELNALGGEWHTGAQLGTEPWVRTQWYQPLDYGYQRFMILGGEFSRDDYSIYDDNHNRIADVRVSVHKADFALGMELSEVAEARLTYSRGYATITEQVGAAVIPDESVHQGSVSLQVVYDSLNDTFFPKHGTFVGLRGQLDREDLGSDRHYDSVTSMFLETQTWNGFNLTGLVYAQAVTRGESGIENAVRLGGFRRLSAFAPGEITGSSALMGAVYASQTFGGPLVPWFAGMGLEAGNAWESLEHASWNSAVHSWSLFTGIDTFLGPLQLATAYNNQDNWTVYLNIGFSFTQLFY